LNLLRRKQKEDAVKEDAGADDWLRGAEGHKDFTDERISSRGASVAFYTPPLLALFNDLSTAYEN
jgi:hypothetical protein